MRTSFKTAEFRALLSCVMFLIPGVLFAQSVYWDPPGGTLGLGKASELSLVFENASPEGDIAIPTVPGLDFGVPAVSRQTSIVNFKRTSRVTYTYTVQPLQKGTIVIPEFRVQTDEGPQTVKSVRFEVGDAAVGQSGLPIDELVQSQITLPTTSAWVGEVIDLDYLLVSTPRYNTSLGSDPIWKPEDLIAEPFGQPEQVEVRQGGQRRPGVRYRIRIQPLKPGRMTLPPVQQRINIQTGNRGSFFFSQPRIEEFLIKSNTPTLEVKPLPQPAPDDFLGAVGQFTIESKIVPENASVGEPITWTLALKGTGNWPAGLRLPERTVSADFEVVQPDPIEEIEEGQMFKGSLTEDAVLVPTKPGAYELGPISFSFFDPASGAYRTEFIDAKTITIQPATSRSPVSPPPQPAPSVTPSLEDATSETPPPAAAPALTLPDDFSAPAQLPRDPLEEGHSAIAPFEFSPAWWFFIAFIPPCIAWLGFAFRMVRREDQTRQRRAAKREMLVLLARMHSSGRMPEAGELARWRKLARQLWHIDRAEPTRDDIGRAVNAAHGKHAIAWVELWREAESALYGADQELPEDWTLRALQAIREVKISREEPGFPHKLRHWAPRLTVIATALLIAYPKSSDAAEVTDARQLYREGKFDQARAIWMKELATNHLDWAVHNNVALAYAQEERWAEAAAHWTAALLLNPSEPAVRANLRLALTRLDGVDPALRRMFSENIRDRLMRLRSPAGWQMVFILGAVVVAGGLACFVAGLYWPPSRRWRRIGVAVATLGVVASALATYGKNRYGPLAFAEAGMIVQPSELHSIPSDLAEEQQKTFLPPGSVVVMDRTFLGWHRVQAAGGSVGWVRREAITPFFAPPHVHPGDSGTAKKETPAIPDRVDART